MCLTHIENLRFYLLIIFKAEDPECLSSIDTLSVMGWGERVNLSSSYFHYNKYLS